MYFICLDRQASITIIFGTILCIRQARKKPVYTYYSFTHQVGIIRISTLRHESSQCVEKIMID